jgi:hypothetical protein
MTGTRPDGATYAYHSLGGDTVGLDISPDGAKAREVNNSKSLISVSKTVGTVVGTGLVVSGLNKGAEIAENGLTNRTAATEATKASTAAGKEATKQAQIAADVQMAEISTTTAP